MTRIDSDPRGAARELLYATLASIPGADPAYERRRHPGSFPVSAGSRAVVVDGYPGSGNSWTTHVVDIAGRRELALAHHRHRPAQILEGVRRGLATALVVRDPLDAIASLVVRHGGNPRVELRRYDYFHARCWPVAARVEVMTFEQTTRSAASIIDRLNRRFGCNLTPLAELGNDAEQQIFDSLEWNARLSYGDAAGMHSPTPSEDRRRQLAAVRDELLDARDANALRRCRRQFARYEELAHTQAG